MDFVRNGWGKWVIEYVSVFGGKLFKFNRKLIGCLCWSCNKKYYFLKLYL